MTKVALIDLGANMNCIQEGLIPLKYYEKSSERLTQANGEKLIINYKIPNVHICNGGICFETIFVLIKDFSSKIILGNPFMTLDRKSTRLNSSHCVTSRMPSSA